MSLRSSWKEYRSDLVVFTTCLVTLCVLSSMGRILFCQCGEWTRFWVNESAGTHTSQHLFDPYSFSHFQHGFVFFWFLALIRRPSLRLAVFIECCWEILENTPFVIGRYREGTVSLDYVGDSIVNSCGDIIAAILGYLYTRRLSTLVAVSTYLAIEVGMLLTIRDCLSLNVIMLLYPIDSIREWQSLG